MRRMLRLVAVAVAVVVVGAAAYVGYVAWRHEQPVSLPRPTGGHAVGRMRVDWTDASRHRELSVWLWYPAVPGTGRPAAYLPGRWRGLHLPAPVGWGETDDRAVRPHERDDARPSSGRFPVVVLVPGLGFSAPMYTSTAVDLASHGYLVAGVTPTGSANLTVLHGKVSSATSSLNPSDFSGGHSAASRRTAERLLRVWVADARFTADRVRRLDDSGRFAGHVGRARVYVGHSFGGATAVQACQEDQHCAGAADLDGALFGPVTRSGRTRALLLVGSQGSCVTSVCAVRDSDDRADRSVAHRLFARGAGPSWSLEVAGTGHFAFTDYSAYFLAWPLRLLLPVGAARPGRALQVTDAYLDAFVARALGRGDSSLLDRRPQPFTEAHLTRRG